MLAPSTSPEFDLTQRRTARLKIAVLPGVVVLQALPLLALRLLLPPEPPAVLVVDRHDVGGVGGGKLRRAADDQEIFVVGVARLRTEVVRAGQQHRIPERIDQHDLAVHHREGSRQLLHFPDEPGRRLVDRGRKRDVVIGVRDVALVEQLHRVLGRARVLVDRALDVEPLAFLALARAGDDGIEQAIARPASGKGSPVWRLISPS